MQDGIAFLLTFAVLWLIAGVLALPAQPLLKWLTILTILAVAVRLPFSASPLPAPASPALFASRLRPVIVINALEYLGIFAAIFWALRHRRTDIVALLISIAVALHFFLLAPLFGLPVYYATGAAILIADLLALRAPAPLRNPIASLATGALLWSTALFLLHQRTHLQA